MGFAALAVSLVMFAVAISTVVGIAEDPAARLDPLESSLHVTATGPVASFTWSTVGYDLSVSDTSTDNGSTLATWYWSFGDGTYYSGKTPPTHAYSSTCSRCSETVSLAVTDAKGAHSVANATVVIQQSGSSSGAGSAESIQGKLPHLGGLATSLPAAIELLLVMFLIAGAAAKAAGNLLLREPDSVQVPIRPRREGS